MVFGVELDDGVLIGVSLEAALRADLMGDELLFDFGIDSSFEMLQPRQLSQLTGDVKEIFATQPESDP